MHGDAYYHLASVLRSGVLGPLFHLRALWGNYARRWDWQTLRKNGGGQLNNTCSHLLAIILPLLGSPVTRIEADLRNIKDAGDTEDHVELLMKTESGVTANLVVSSAVASSSMPRWMLCGKYGTLTSDGTTSKLRYYAPAKVAPLEVLDAAAPGRKYFKETLPWVEEEQEVGPWLLGKDKPVVTVESVLEVVRVIEMAQRAAVE